MKYYMKNPMLDTFIDNTLLIDTRPLNVLMRNGINYLSTLVLMTKDQVKSIKNIGPKGFEQIEESMISEVNMPLCNSIEESKERFAKRYGNRYIKYADIIRKVNGEDIRIKKDDDYPEYYIIAKEVKSGKHKGLYKVLGSFSIEILLIMYNWNEPKWVSRFKCGDYIIQ